MRIFPADFPARESRLGYRYLLLVIVLPHRIVVANRFQSREKSHGGGNLQKSKLELQPNCAFMSTLFGKWEKNYYMEFLSMLTFTTHKLTKKQKAEKKER